MINNTIQGIWYKGLYYFRDYLCFDETIYQMVKNTSNYDIHYLYDNNLVSEQGKKYMAIIQGRDNATSQEYSDAFDYFIQYKEQY